MIPLITNIQKYSLHDGDGIRTTVFFKGCPLTCAWCHNPETQCYDRQLLIDRERCTGCSRCVNICPDHAVGMDSNSKTLTNLSLCGLCGLCVPECIYGRRQIIGRTYTPYNLLELLRQDMTFYEQSGGGVTLSGGEVLAQEITYITDLAKLLQREGISMNIDTCGYAPFENFMHVLPFTDVFLYDIKLMDPARHLAFTGKDNQLILDNLRKLSTAGAKIVVRIPVIIGVNAYPQDMDDIVLWLINNTIHVNKINLLPYHNTGSGKYARLGADYPGAVFTTPSEAQMNEFAGQFVRAGFTNVTIG